MLSGRDIIEEFISAAVSPLGRGEFPDFDFKKVKLEYVDEPVPLPTLEVIRADDEDNDALVARVEYTVDILVGSYTEREHNSQLVILGNLPRLNCIFEYSSIPYGERDGFLVFCDKKGKKDGKPSGRGKRKIVASKTAIREN